MRPFSLRAWIAGLISLPALAAGGVAGTVLFWPGIVGLKTFARIFDSLAPQLVVCGLAATLLLVLLRAPRWLWGLALAVNLGAAGLVGGRHLVQAAPFAAGPADLTVLWFNMLGDNRTPTDVLAAALAESPADFIVLAEAEPFSDVLDGGPLEAAFPVRIGCRNPRCGVLVLARAESPPARIAIHRIGRLQEERLAILQLDLPGRAPFDLVAAHLVKPWFFGFSENDDWFLYHHLEGRTGPLVLMGDFNSAPWAARLQDLHRDCALAPVRRPPATWPLIAGRAGVPIDNVMVRGGARLTGLTPWGETLGSNHLGLLFGVAIPAEGAAMPSFPDCVPPD